MCGHYYEARAPYVPGEQNAASYYSFCPSVRPSLLREGKFLPMKGGKEGRKEGRREGRRDDGRGRTSEGWQWKLAG